MPRKRPTKQPDPPITAPPTPVEVPLAVQREQAELALRDSINLEVWNQVCKTPAEYCHPYMVGDKKLTAIDPHHQLQEATRLWGPYGDKWGVGDQEWSFLRNDSVLLLHANFFCPVSSFYLYVDHPYTVGGDCYKSLLTIFRSKALSYLGFNADVFLGAFDDLPTPAQSNTTDLAENAIREATTTEALLKIRQALHQRSMAGKITEADYKRLVALADEKRLEFKEEPDAKPDGTDAKAPAAAGVGS